MSKINYVVGFLFSTDHEVLLIRKSKPEWQAGKLNGIGGKIEAGETPVEAMVREFQEEAGVTYWPWSNFGLLRGTDFNVHLFYAFSNEVFWKASSQEQELIERWDVSRSVPKDSIANLNWLIPAVLHSEGEFIEADYAHK